MLSTVPYTQAVSKGDREGRLGGSDLDLRS